MEAEYLLQGWLVPKWHLLPSIAQKNNSTLGSTRGGSVGILTYQSMSALLHLGKSTTSYTLGIECFQPSVDISGELCISSCISSPTSLQVSGRTCHRSIQIPNSNFTLLDRGSLAFYSSQQVERHSSLVPTTKDLIRDTLVGQTLKGVSLLYLRNVCCTDEGSLPQSFSSCGGNSDHLQQRFTSNVERMDMLLYSRECTKQGHFCS